MSGQVRVFFGVGSSGTWEKRQSEAARYHGRKRIAEGENIVCSLFPINNAIQSGPCDRVMSSSKPNSGSFVTGPLLISSNNQNNRWATESIFIKQIDEEDSLWLKRPPFWQLCSCFNLLRTIVQWRRASRMLQCSPFRASSTFTSLLRTLLICVVVSGSRDAELSASYIDNLCLKSWQLPCVILMCTTRVRVNRRIFKNWDFHLADAVARAKAWPYETSITKCCVYISLYRPQE